MFSNKLINQNPCESTTIIYALHDGISEEVTRENFGDFLEKGAFFFKKLCSSDPNFSSPVDVQCSGAEVAQWLAQNNTSTINTPDVSYYAYLDNVKVGISMERLGMLQQRNATFTKQTNPADGFINPIEQVIELKEVLVKAAQKQRNVDQQNIQQPIDSTSLVPKNNIGNIVVAERAEVEVKKSRKNKEENAALLAKELLEHCIIRYIENGLYFWNGSNYTILDLNTLECLCLQYCCESIFKTGSAGLLKSISYFIRRILGCNASKLEDPSALVVFNNGVFNFNTNRLEPKNSYLSNYIIMFSINADFDLTTQCNTFDRYVYQLAGGNSKLIKRIWQVLGMLLSSDVKVKRIVVLSGVGGSGKSTFGDIVTELINENNVTAFDPEELLGQYAGTSLVNSAINICMDLPNIPLSRKVVARLKKMSGDDYVQGEIKFMEHFKYKFKGHLLFGTNYDIKTSDLENSFASRLLIIPCMHTIPKEMQDHYLIDKIKKERSAIATKAIIAYAEVRNNHYQFEGDDEWGISEMSICVNNDSCIQALLSQFLNENCVITDSNNDFTESCAIYDAFSTFCNEKGYENTFTSASLSRELGKRIPGSITRKIRNEIGTFNVRTRIILHEN